MNAVSALDTSTVATTESIRSHFPALQRVHNGHAVAYFDGPGGTQVPQRVVDVVSDYLLHHNANTHWAYPTSEETDAMLAAAREALADFLGASAGEIAFGANMTTLLYHISRAIGRQLGAGDEIVVTELDHHANIAPWQALAKERGAVLRWVPLDTSTGRHVEGALASVVNERTRVIAIGAASNALGTVSDLSEALRLARKVEAYSVVDAVHYAPHMLTDAQQLDCDFLLCSAYKFYGPHIGVVYGRREAVESLDIPRLEPAPDWVPESLETGTQNHEGIVGAAAAVDFLANLCEQTELPRRERLSHTFSALHHRGASLVTHMWDGLASVSRVRVFPPAPDTPRTATLSFVLDGIPSETVARKLAERGVFVSHGDFYASTVIERLGMSAEGVVRAGCACYTTDTEVDRLIDGVAQLARGHA